MHTIRFVSSLALLAVAACEIAPKRESPAKQDTTTAPATSGGVTTGAPLDTGSTAGVPAVPADSVAADSGVVQLHPERPRRGDVLFAYAEAAGGTIPRCSWKGASLPCYRQGTGVLAVVPLSADEPAGTYTLTFDGGPRRVSREITVSDREFGRELIFLDKPLYDKVRNSATVARDARAIRGILAAETAERQWSGRWREPLAGAKGEGYGVERFYYPASDSSRSIQLPASARARGAFAADTTTGGPNDVPSWQHAGIDLAARRGAAVLAPAAGTVADVGEYILSGRTVLLDHGQGVFSAYFHLDTALVRRGDQVRSAKVIGRVGATGLATGPHLHYGVYVHGRDVNPLAWRDIPGFARADTSARTGAKPPARR